MTISRCVQPKGCVCLLPPNWCRLFAAALSSRGGAEKLGAEAWHRFQRVFHGSPPPNIRRNNRGTANAQTLGTPLLLAYDGDKRFDIISITGLIANKVWVSFWCASSSTFKATENPLLTKETTGKHLSCPRLASLQCLKGQINPHSSIPEIAGFVPFVVGGENPSACWVVTIFRLPNAGRAPLFFVESSTGRHCCGEFVLWFCVFLYFSLHTAEMEI